MVEGMETKKDSDVKLPVMAILAAAFAVPWSNKVRFSQALAITFFILVLVDFLYGQTGSESGSEFFVYLIFSSFVYVSFAVTCHRLVLLGSESVPQLGVFRWSRREFRFFIWMIKLSIAFVVMFIPVLMLVSFIFKPEPRYVTPMLIASSIPFLYFLSRVILLFPSTATDKIYDYKWAYKLTEGNGLQMMIVVVLIPVIMVGVHELNGILFGEGRIIGLLNLALGYIVTVFEIAAISLSYDFLSKNEPKVRRAD